MSIREVEQARVHITLAKDSLYTESRQPAKASVLVKLRHAAALSPQNVAAICQLTASAVPGLSAEQVSLVDTSGNLLNRPRAAAAGDAAGHAKRRSTIARASSTICRTRSPRRSSRCWAPNHFRAGVSADVDLTSGEQSEETFDPQKSVMVTSQTTAGRSGAALRVGRSRNRRRICRVPFRSPSTGASNYARHTENVTYQTSRVVKHTRSAAGRGEEDCRSRFWWIIRCAGKARRQARSSSRPRPKS